jgi:hypothetical protein
MRIRDHQMSARAEDPPKFGQCSAQVRNVNQGQGAHHEVHATVGYGQSSEFTHLEIGAGKPRPGHRQHLWRGVHSDDAMTEPHELDSVPAGSAAGVQGVTSWQTCQNRVDDRLLQVNQLVARVVVGGRPVAVDIVHTHATKLAVDTGGLNKFGVRQQGSDLGQPRKHELSVGRPVAYAAEKGGTLNTKQVGKRMEMDLRSHDDSEA